MLQWCTRGCQTPTSPKGTVTKHFLRHRYTSIINKIHIERASVDLPDYVLLLCFDVGELQPRYLVFQRAIRARWD
jgi:hypothetical protein